MVNTGQDSEYNSNDICAMANQTPVTEREGEYESFEDFNLDNTDEVSIEYLFEEVLEETAEVSVAEELEANYGHENKLQDLSGLEL